MKYDSIINLPHYEPKYHKRMSKMQRAAQFNPFSALTGYDDMVKEVSRLVNERIEISEDKKEEISIYQLRRRQKSANKKVTFYY